MATETNQPQASSISRGESSPAVSDEAARLAEHVERRRKELGIKPNEPKRTDFSTLKMFQMPERDEAAERAAEAAKAELESRAEQVRRRNSWRNLCDEECEAYRNVSVDGYALSEVPEVARDQQAVVKAIRTYIETLPQRVRAGEGILFFGPCGTGKDHLAMSVCREAVLSHGFSVERINGPEWFGRLRDLMGQESANEAKEVKRLAQCDLLLISDPIPPIGDLTPYQAAMLYRVVEKRAANYKATIVTANVEGSVDAAKKMGAATVERMKFGAWVIPCNWPSFRKPAYVVGE